MPEFFLEAQTRTKNGKAVRGLRRGGQVPAVVYGHGVATRSLELDAARLLKIWRAAGESSLIDLTIDTEQPIKAIIHDIQLDPTNEKILHADFQQVNMKEKIQVDVALEFIGESPAVKELGGTLLKVMDAIKVECLPGDLVKEIIVDISALKTFDDTIHVKDLPIPATLTVEDQPEELVVQVEPPRTEEELKSLEEKVDVDVTKVEDAEKKPEEPTEEAAEPTKE